jgi:hypothetical protein
MSAGDGSPVIRTTRNAVAVELIGVHKWFGEFHALDGIDLSRAR